MSYNPIKKNYIVAEKVTIREGEAKCHIDTSSHYDKFSVGLKSYMETIERLEKEKADKDESEQKKST